MSQEASTRSVTGLLPQYTPFISRLEPIDTNHLLTSWGIQVAIHFLYASTAEFILETKISLDI